MHEAARHQQAGDLVKAEAMYRQILKRHPDHPDALHLLGMVTHLMGDTRTAVGLIRRVIRRYPDFPEAHNTLGNILKNQGDTAGAVACYRKAVKLRPEHVSAHYNLGNCYRDVGNLEKAAACYRRAVEINPEYAKGHNALGGILRDQDKAAEAIACHRRALAINPRYAAGYYGLACVLQVLGRFDEATTQFEKALAIEPDYAGPYQGLAAMRKTEPGDELIARMQELLDTAALSRADRILLDFALGKCFDDTGEYDEAFEHYRSANELKKLVEPFNAGDFTRKIDRVIETFTRRLVEEKAALGTSSELPVFVVGMPRSGTTLVEQILASHPRVVGAGELRLIGRMGENLPGLLQASVPYPECARLLDAATVLRLAQGYLDHVEALAGGAARVVDKEPVNFAHLGLIATLFPRARIIHCQRDPMDTCLSCYFQDFRSQAFANDLSHIGLYYQTYRRLMAHWRRVLSMPVLDLCYEDLATDPEGASRRMIDFCGLGWDDACLDFTNTDRAVLTASFWQSRQPIYKTSIGRWRRYEKHLGPLKRALQGAT